MTRYGLTAAGTRLSIAAASQAAPSVNICSLIDFGRRWLSRDRLNAIWLREMDDVVRLKDAALPDTPLNTALGLQTKDRDRGRFAEP